MYVNTNTLYVHLHDDMRVTYTVHDCCLKDSCNAQSSVTRKRSREVWGRRVVEITHDSPPSPEHRDTHRACTQSHGINRYNMYMRKL